MKDKSHYFKSLHIKMVSKAVKVAAPIIGVITAVIIIVVIIVTTTDNIEETGMYIKLGMFWSK